MEIKEYKSYLSFAVSIVFFLVIIGYGLYLYSSWDQPVPQEDMAIEVNLPIVDWSKYTSLSKQYKVDKVN